MEKKFLKFHSKNKEEEIKNKWKILNYLEEDLQKNQKQSINIHHEHIKISHLRKLFAK